MTYLLNLILQEATEKKTPSDIPESEEKLPPVDTKEDKPKEHEEGGLCFKYIGLSSSVLKFLQIQ